MLNSQETKLFHKLSTPKKIQDFLDTLKINFERGGETCYSPRLVLQKKRAHCVEAALFAAAVLWHHGKRPLLLDLKTSQTDLDHVVALYRQDGFWGAISKTNHAVLRFREPVYKSVRELAMSYFHEYYLDSGLKTLRSFSKPFDLRQFGKEWVTSDKPLWRIATALDRSPHVSIINRKQIRNLRPVDKIEIKAGNISEWK